MSSNLSQYNTVKILVRPHAQSVAGPRNTSCEMIPVP